MAKRIMRTFKLREVSNVDRPAQAGALALLLKRAEGKKADDLKKELAAPAAEIAEAMAKAWVDPSAGARSYADVLGTMLKDEQYYEEMRLIQPFINALDISIRSITGDSKLDKAAKQASLKDAVLTFMTDIWDKVPNGDAPGVMEGVLKAYDLCEPEPEVPDEIEKRLDILALGVRVEKMRRSLAG